ncbi:MAG TPA: hypothetical protein DDW50_11545 [Firmicutes bacterium]|jgi:spermidine synthase/MFS family permease|nr:hypothetical protein [Bacillota bacterium]
MDISQIAKKKPNPFTLNHIMPCFPYLAAFLSQMVLMTLELVASRLMGSHYGNSLYTWAAVIGIILFGNSLGSYWGGIIAERNPSYFLLARFLILSALGCIFVLILNWLLGSWIPFPWMNWPLQIFITAFILFTLPSLLLGTLTPLTAKLALTHSICSHKWHSGIILGNIFAWGALGSIVGTLLTGFLFIAILGSMQILFLITLILILLGFLFLFFALFNQAHPNLMLSNQHPNQHENNTESLSVEPSYKKLDNTGVSKPIFSKKISYLVAFLAASTLMMIEFLGGRLLSRYYGNSIFSWTSNISFILVGITIGYFIGGRLAEKQHPEKFLSPLFGIASILVLTIIVNMNFFWTSPWPNQLSLPWQILLGSMFTILFPAIAIGSITPINYKLALQSAPTAAPIIGSLNAWAIVGSFCGTLLTGFWFIATLGTIQTLLALSLVLAIICWWLSTIRPVATVWILLLIGIIGISVTKSSFLPREALDCAQTLGLRVKTDDLLFAVDSPYQYVKVYQKECNPAHDVRVLALDSLIHGFIDLKDPSDLRYDYEHIYQNLTRRYLSGKECPKAFFIGAGSYTFPRWMLYQWPKSQIDVAEIDPVVVAANRLALGFPQNTPIHTYIGDARGTIRNLPTTTKYDLFFGDAFNDLSVPWHLTTLEFIRMIKNHLNPDGAYLLNVIDNYDNGKLVGASYLTLRKVFPHVYVFCTNPLQIQNIRDTFILLASDVPLNIHHWHSGPIGYGDGVLLEPQNLRYLAMRCGNLVLTDNYAPVENLLAPVVRKRKLK